MLKDSLRNTKFGQFQLPAGYSYRYACLKRWVSTAANDDLGYAASVAADLTFTSNSSFVVIDVSVPLTIC